MEREIKFRAWDRFRMIHFDTMTIGITKVTKKEPSNPYVYFKNDTFKGSVMLGNHEIMQYIGLKDKNGKEIYEGDVIEFIHPLVVPVKNWRAKVVFDEQTASFGIIGGNTTVKGIIQPFSDWDEPQEDLLQFIEIIGNIHENPELLK